MNKQVILPTLKQFIAEDQFKKALELLSLYVADTPNDIEDDILMQKARLTRNTRDYKKGILTREVYQIEMARLADSLNYIIEHLPATGNPVDKSMLIDTPSKGQNMKILFLTANPINPESEALRIGAEMRAIKDEIKRSSGRDLFELIFEPAVQIPTITRAMREYRPQIVHFSGHGYGEGIAVEGVNGEIVYFPTEGLDMLFGISDHVECVLLNACYSSEQAKVISAYDIYVVGMSDEINDNVAKQFAVGFYQGLGGGDSPETSYKIAMINIVHQRKYAKLPELWYKGEKISS